MKQKRVGILTLPFTYNYGGVLQTYALQQYLIKNKIDAVHIYRNFPEPNKLVQNSKDILKFLLRKRSKLKKEGKDIRKFFDKYIQPRTHEVRTPRDLVKLRKYDFSTVIVGSDQVWRKYCIYGDLKANYFLDFVPDNSCKIAFAASFGVDKWEYDDADTSMIQNLISKFSAISVREKTGTKLCRDFMKVEAKHIWDPVLLLTPEDYKKLINEEKEPEVEGDCLVYILDETPEKMEIINNSSKLLNQSTYTISSNTTQKPSVTRWLKAFESAKFVITDSFHGCMFSILFNKPFLIIGNVSRGLSRFTSILEDVDLTDRMILSSKEKYSDILAMEIDWDKINQRLKHQRSISQRFLKENIV